RRPDLGIRRWTRIAQHVHANRAAGPLVHRRQLRAMPHLLEISRPTDQGLRSGPLALRHRTSAWDHKQLSARRLNDVRFTARSGKGAKRGSKPFLPRVVPFDSRQWPMRITLGPGPASLADLP